MILESDSPVDTDVPPPEPLHADLADLRQALAHHRFPTDQDHLIAACIARHAPSRMLWRLAALNRTRAYHSLDQVCSEVVEFTRVHMDSTGSRRRSP